MLRRQHNSRPLSQWEKDVIPASIAAGIDVSRVEIHHRKWTPLTPHNVTVVRGYKIFYPNDMHAHNDLMHCAHLVHEIVHVWQYNYLGIGLYSPRWLDRRYAYFLNEGDRLLDFGLEQQASIAEDFFRVSHGLKLRHARNNPPLARLETTVKNCSKPRTVQPHDYKMVGFPKKKP